MTAAAVAPAELVIRGARIITMADAAPEATALAVAGGAVVAIGSEDDVAPYIGMATVVRELGGAAVLPGFIDAHNHPLQAGKASLFELVLSPDASVEEVCTAVAEYVVANEVAADAWIVGSGWGTALLADLGHVAALNALDAASGGRPVLLVDDSRHNRWVSSRALGLAGIAAGTPDPERGTIVHDPESGVPTGLLFEAAGLLVEDAAAGASALDDNQLEAAAARAVELLHAFGITAFQDAAASTESMRAFSALDERGALTAWVVSSMTVNDQIFGFSELGDALIAQRDAVRTTHHRPDFIKIFLDGTPPAFTGAFLHPYLDDGHHGADFTGQTTMPFDDMLGWLRKAAELDISAKIHCSGDAAVRIALDAVEQIRAEGFTTTRYHIAHGQFVSAEDLPRLAALGVVAEISPFFWFPGVIADALRMVRPENEIGRMQPNRSLLDSGAALAVGSDWPVSETPNAWVAIQGLVTRADPSGQHAGTLVPEEAITLREALAAVTVAAAAAIGLGDTIGSLEVGKSADFIVVDRDPFACPPSELATIVVQETWQAGVGVFRRSRD